MNPSNQPNLPTQGPPTNQNRPTQGFTPYLQPQFANQGFLSPQGGSIQANRGVYASTIQASTSSSNFSKGGFGKLESMGRTIKEDNDTIDSRPHQAPNLFYSQPNHLSFNSNNERGKLASSVIFQKNYDEDINRFPGFNVGGQIHSTSTGVSKLDALLLAKKQNAQTPVEEVAAQNPQQKRKRQINAIKQQLEFLNKRMENTVKKGDGQSKPYFQLASRKANIHQISTLPNQVDQPKMQNQPIYSNPIAESVQQSSSGNKSFFQHYSKGNSEQIANQHVGSSQTVNQFSGPNIIINHISSQPKPNQAKPYQPPQVLPPNPVKPEGGMFKKKNPYLLEQPAKGNEPAPKTFLLSPRGAIANQGLKIQIKPQPKSSEIVQVAQKTIKKTSSNQDLKAVRKWKKSDFAIGKSMGKGQFGEVMLVQHKQTGFLCGMKVMSKKQIREQKYVNQIARELSIQFFLNHRNVAPLYGYFEDEENVYLLIEYCTGGQLLQLLRKAHRMQEADTSPIIRQICEGLDYIHKEEIIHRDIKPENILFNFNTVKICDFGWAVHCGSGMRKTVSGSPLYYSPQVVQETEYDEKVDIWAVGMMTYECLLGKIPFRIYSELDLNRIVEDQVKFPEYVDVSEDSKSFILGIMQKNPDDRMVMKDIFKHPFIRKYLNEKKVASEILEEFRRVLN